MPFVLLMVIETLVKVLEGIKKLIQGSVKLADIRHFLQRKTTVEQVKVITGLEPSNMYDVIFVVMKYADFDSVFPIPAKNESKNILLLGNNAIPKVMKDKLKSQSVNEKKIAFGFQISGRRKYNSRDEGFTNKYS